MNFFINFNKIAFTLTALLVMGLNGMAVANSNFPNSSQTPIGAERGANGDGTIPEWTGGLIKPPKDILRIPSY